MVVLDQRFDVAAREQQGAEQVARHAGLMQHLLDRQRAARHVAGVLQEHAVAGHQRGRGGAEHLPEREIPRHHREHDADRIEGDERFAAADVGRLVGEIFLRRDRRTSRSGRRISRPRRGRRRASCPSPRSSAAANSSLRARRISAALRMTARRGRRSRSGANRGRPRARPAAAAMRLVERVRVVGLARLAGRRVDRLQLVGRRFAGRVSSACSAMIESPVRRP